MPSVTLFSSSLIATTRALSFFRLAGSFGLGHPEMECEKSCTTAFKLIFTVAQLLPQFLNESVGFIDV